MGRPGASAQPSAGEIFRQLEGATSARDVLRTIGRQFDTGRGHTELLLPAAEARRGGRPHQL